MDVNQIVMVGLASGGAGAAVGGISALIISRQRRKNPQLDSKRATTISGLAVAVAAVVSGQVVTSLQFRGHGARNVDLAPEVRAWTEQQKEAGRSAAEVEALAVQLSAHGVRRLDHEGLEVRARIMKTFLETAPTVGDCAALSRGDSPAAIQAAIERLSPASHDEWMKTSQRAIVAELRQTPPLPLDPQALEQAFAAIVAALPEGDRLRFANTLQNVAGASDEDMCWTARTLYARTFALPLPHRQVAFRSFVEQ